jgi:hypothetical protein
MLVGKCKLCLQTKTLQDSHYLPKGAYKVNRAPALKNPNPVVLSGDEAKQVSAQLKDYVLCSDCEQRFSKNGEQWVLGNIPRDYDKPFPLYEALRSETPVLRDGGVSSYAGRSIKTVDMEKLVYFAISVFWRGAVHEWKSVQGGRPPTVYLCGYEEPIRNFLLGAESFPLDVALWVFVCPSGRKLNAMLVPSDAHIPECSRYWFYISGLGFMLHFASNLPSHFKTMCAHHSPEGVLIVSTEFEKVVRQVLSDELANRDASKLRYMLQEIHRVRSAKSP